MNEIGLQALAVTGEKNNGRNWSEADWAHGWAEVPGLHRERFGEKLGKGYVKGIGTRAGPAGAPQLRGSGDKLLVSRSSGLSSIGPQKGRGPPGPP